MVLIFGILTVVRWTLITKPGTLNFIKEKVKSTFEHIGNGDHILIITPAPQTLREKIKKWDCLTLCSFCKTKDTVNNIKQPTEWQKKISLTPHQTEIWSPKCKRTQQISHQENKYFKSNFYSGSSNMWRICKAFTPQETPFLPATYISIMPLLCLFSWFFSL